jgi:hypothetical protein
MAGELTSVRALGGGSPGGAERPGGTAGKPGGAAGRPGGTERPGGNTGAAATGAGAMRGEAAGSGEGARNGSGGGAGSGSLGSDTGSVATSVACGGEGEGIGGTGGTIVSFWRLRLVSVAGVTGRAGRWARAGVEGLDDEACDGDFACDATAFRSCCVPRVDVDAGTVAALRDCRVDAVVRRACRLDVALVVAVCTTLLLFAQDAARGRAPIKQLSMPNVSGCKRLYTFCFFSSGLVSGFCVLHRVFPVIKIFRMV